MSTGMAKTRRFLSLAALVASVTVTVASMASAAGPPIGLLPPSAKAVVPDRTRTFLEHLYQDVLGRPIDPAALTQFGSQLAQGSMTRAQVVQVVLGSAENAAVVVRGLYILLLHRQPDPQGLAAFVDALQHGTTAEQIASLLVASDEYALRAGGGFLDAAYQDLLGRHADGPARAQSAQSIIGSDEYASAVVTSLYMRYLRRPADAQGLSAMRLVFRQGGSRAVSAILLASDEYYAR
jgi:hypothetical protein